MEVEGRIPRMLSACNAQCPGSWLPPAAQDVYLSRWFPMVSRLGNILLQVTFILAPSPRWINSLHYSLFWLASRPQGGGGGGFITIIFWLTLDSRGLTPPPPTPSQVPKLTLSYIFVFYHYTHLYLQWVVKYFSFKKQQHIFCSPSWEL